MATAFCLNVAVPLLIRWRKLLNYVITAGQKTAPLALGVIVNRLPNAHTGETAMRTGTTAPIFEQN